MDSIHPYITIGSIILNLILVIIFLVLYLPQAIRIIRSSLIRLRTWLGGRPTAVDQWRWWKQYRPSCEIVKVGVLKITKSTNQYHMELIIESKYTSRDNRYNTLMDINNVYLDVYNTGKGRDNKPYRLHRSDMPLKIYPIDEDNDGGFLVVALSWNLPCGESVIIRYDLWGQIDVPPLVGTSTSCKMVAIGKAKIERVPISKELRVDGKFLVEVVKEYEN